MKKVWIVLLSLLLVCSVSLAEDAVSSATLNIEKLPEAEAQDNGILVVYFSPDDTVRAAAYTIADVLSAELFEIEPVVPYTAEDLNYMDRKSRSVIEMGDSEARPEIVGLPEDLSACHTVILCYPIWGGQAPKIVITFLENVDMTGKTVIPFATSNSSGIGNSDKTLRSVTGESVEWLTGIGVRRGAGEQDIRLWAESLNLGK